MNTCLKHGQMYPPGSYCPYCGLPTTSPTCTHEWIPDTTGMHCRKCSQWIPVTNQQTWKPPLGGIA